MTTDAATCGEWEAEAYPGGEGAARGPVPVPVPANDPAHDPQAPGASVLCVRLAPTAAAPAPEALPLLLALLRAFTPVVAALPPDAALADLRGAVRYFGRDVRELAAVIRVRALALYGMTCTIGIGPGPMAARAAARAAAPGSTLAVPAGRHGVAEFLADRPVTALPGVGAKAARSLGAYGLDTVGSVAAAPLPTVQRLIGARAGREVHEKARGIDRTHVVPNAAARSAAAARSFDRDELDPFQHRRALLSMTAELGAGLRGQGQVCRLLTLTVRCADRSGHAAITRSRTLPEPTAHCAALTRAAYRMYEALGLQRARVRTLALRAEGLGPAEHAARQLSFDPTDDKARRIEEVADRARARFGPHAVTFSTLKGCAPTSTSPFP